MYRYTNNMPLNKKAILFLIPILFTTGYFFSNFTTVHASDWQSSLAILCDYLDEVSGVNESGYCPGSSFQYVEYSGGHQIYGLGSMAVGQYIEIIGEGYGRAEWCLNGNGIWLNGPCWATTNIDVIDDAPPRSVWIEFFNVNPNDYSLAYNHFMMQLYANDAKWNLTGNPITVNGQVSNGPPLIIKGRKVSANFTSVPTQVAVNDTFDVYWNWQWYMSGRDFWTTGDINCSWVDDPYNPYANCTALAGSGQGTVHISASGPTGQGEQTVQDSRDITIDSTAANADAVCVSITAPATVQVNQAFTATATMKNTGGVTWENATGEYSLGSQPQDNMTWALNRIPLPSQPIVTNQEVTFTINATAPGTTGTYPFNWKMVDDGGGHGWFGETCQGNSGAGINVTESVSSPTGLNSVCNAAGNQLTRSWDPVAGATSYLINLNFLANDNGGWFISDPPDINGYFVTTTTDTVPVTPGASYNWWIHAMANGVYSPAAVSGTVVCNAAPPPTVDNVTISSPTIVPDNSTQYNIVVTGSDPGGGSKISSEYALINFQGSNGDGTEAKARGYFTWSSTEPAWSVPCTGNGGGNALLQGSYGSQYIYSLDSCINTVSGNTRTTTFTVRFNSSFTAPTTNNDISGFVVNTDGNSDGWDNFDLNFGLAAAPVDGAEFISQNVPASVTVDEVFQVTITMKNTGTTIWDSDAFYRIGLLEPSPPVNEGPWGKWWDYITSDVAIGATKVFTFDLTAPSSIFTGRGCTTTSATSMNCNFLWQMVHDAYNTLYTPNIPPGWFGDQTPPSVFITVNAALPTYTLTVIGDAGGTISSNDGTINGSCTPAACSVTYVSPTTVTLTATPSSSFYTFVGWSGTCSGTGTCSVAVGSSTTVSANFAPRSFNYIEF